MRKHLSCRAMGMNCSFEVHDESEEEITVVIRGHLERVHRIEMTNALSQKARDLILLDMASNRK
jgi:predicted small metal-binding protein